MLWRLVVQHLDESVPGSADDLWLADTNRRGRRRE
jgi:hypothetical protein